MRFRAPHALMVQGTTSGAGKSTLVAAMCRQAARSGIRVAPFKPQNMSLNSAVTQDGREIGRAQALQAIAARVPATADMNPILLKPSSDVRAQVVVHGRPVRELDAIGYQAWKRDAMPFVLESFHRLSASHDAIVVEGAGSPAEINLREHDLANMGFAEAADCPVILVADIDRGGVFAHLVGTLECLAESERARVLGFVINRFRGDPALLEGGLRWLSARTGKPVLGVLPYLHGLDLDAEDALPEETRRADALKVIVPAVPRISNHTDFDALRAHPSVDFRFVGPGDAIPPADLVVLPGSKNVRADLAFLVERGWPEAIRRHLRYGGRLVGICGGLQMLGGAIEDPEGIEGEPGTSAGLGYFDFRTTLQPEKVLRNVEGILFPGTSRAARFAGYEIHQGISRGPALASPATEIAGRAEGVLSDDARILGTYVHGIFDRPEACAALLEWAGLAGAGGVDREARREASLERLADALDRHVDFSKLPFISWPPDRRTPS